MWHNMGIRNFNLKNETLIIFQKAIMVATCDIFGCTYACKNNPELSFHRIPAANAQNKWFRQRWIQKFPWQKMKTFLFVRIILEKTGSNVIWRWWILCLFPYSGNPTHNPAVFFHYSDGPVRGTLKASQNRIYFLWIKFCIV